MPNYLDKFRETGLFKPRSSSLPGQEDSFARDANSRAFAEQAWAWGQQQANAGRENHRNALQTQLLQAQVNQANQPNVLAQAIQQPAPQLIPEIARSRLGTPADYAMGVGRTNEPEVDDRRFTRSLRDLLTKPGSFQRTPGFRAALDTGRQAIERQFAARGMGNSGNVLAELMKYGTGLASREYGGQVDRLAGLSRMEQTMPDYWDGVDNPGSARRRL